MKFFLLTLLSFFSFSTFAQKGSGQSFYQTRPQSFTPVNDYAGMFSPDERELLAKKLQQYRDTSTNVIVIITQNTLKDANTGEVYQLEEAAKHYFNNWGIGLKEKNNGVLFFIVRNDRKIRIATGKGIENVLNDNDCQDIIDEIIVPHFKQTNYYSGIDKAVDKVMQILSPELYAGTNAVTEPSNSNSTLPPSSQSYAYQPDTNNNGSSTLPFIIFIFILAVIFLMIVRLFRNNNPNNTVYNSDGASTSSFARRAKLTWFLSGIFFSGLFNNRNSSNRNYNSNINSEYNNNDSYRSIASDSFSSSSDSGSSFGGGSSEGGGASGSW